MKLRLLSSPFALLTALAAFGCSSTSSSSAPKTDGGAPTDGGATDTGTKSDAPSTGDTGPAGGDAGPVPEGTLLQGGDAIQLLGVTTDGYAVYFEGDATTQTTSIYAISTSGGTQKLVTACISTGCTAAVIGPDVIVFPGASTTGIGAESVWTSTKGIAQLAMTAYDGVLNASADGTKVIYTSNVPDTGKTGDLYVANNDGTGATKLLTGIQLQAPCAPVAGFAGSSSTVVVAYCPGATATDGGVEAGPTDAGAEDAAASTAIATIASFSGATYTQATLATNVLAYWTSDKVGDKISLTNATGELQVIPLPSGTAETLDNVGPTGAGYVLSSGTSAVYVTPAPASDLKNAPIPPTTPVTLTTGVGGISAFSDDYNWTLFYKNTNTTTNFEDLFLASTTKAGTPLTLSSTVTAVLFGNNFTTDSSYVTYYLDAVSTTNVGIVGTLTAMPVAGGTATTLGTDVWDNLSGTGTQVVFNDAFAAGTQASTGFANIKWVDVSKSAAPTLLVSGADATPSSIVLNAAKDHVVYTFSQSGQNDAGPDLNGLYSVALPQ